MNKVIRRIKTRPIRLAEWRRTLLPVLTFSCFAMSGYSQHVIVKPSESQKPSTTQQKPATNQQQPASHHPVRDTSKVIDIREKLVQLALQNPSYEIADRQVNKSVYELRKAKGSWLNPVAGQLNLNEVSIKQGNTIAPGAIFYPRWNVGVTVPLDILTTKKNEVKIAKENLLISEAERNQRYREIRAEVLTRYEDYLMYKEMLDIQARITQDQYSIYATKEKDYQDGIINQEEYNKYFTSYSQNKSRVAEAVRNLNVAKVLLEQIIGVPLDQALGTK